MLDRVTRVQLAIFAIVTVLTVGAISAFYLHLPAAVGIGSYKINANFVAGGGLYENANVTYRGVTIGRVESVGLTNDGVVANMRLNSNTPVPANVTATVKSVSAVGEQYIDLVPPEEPASDKLRNGSSIDQQHTAIGQDIAGLLKEADNLVSSIGDSRVQELLSETFKAFNGSGPELARLIQSARLLVDEANANYGQVTQLIDQAGPFLDAQIRGGDNIRSLADGLARFTGEVANADQQVRSVLQAVPGATEAANTTFSGIRPTFPILAANLANFGRIGVIYNKSLEQALVIFPALIAGLSTVAGGVPGDEGGKLDFKISLQDPPPCSVGFIPPPLIRTPADTTLRELPPRPVLQGRTNDASVVRGARNYPCQEFPGKRAPTIQLCRDPQGYVPIGSNPWRGPPIPVGTPMDEREDNHFEPPGRNILPPNKFPYIPPQVDPDPGPPVVQLPPGVPPGPGPAPHAPFPLPVPPNEPGAPPPPWPFFAPPDQLVPPYGRTPPPPGPAPRAPADAAPPPAEPPPPLPAEAPAALASGPAVATYDQNGKFVDPAGGIGVYAPGAGKLAPAENWVRPDAGSKAGVMTEERASGQEAPKPATPVRRRASRAAGPAGGTVNGSRQGCASRRRRPSRCGCPSRRTAAAPSPESAMVAIVSLAVFVAAIALSAVVIGFSVASGTPMPNWPRPTLRRHRLADRGEHVQLHPGHHRRQRQPVRQQHQRPAARHDESGRERRTSSCSSGTPTPVPKR